MFSDHGELKFKIYDKRDDFGFEIVNFPHMDSNVPVGPTYGVYVSRLIAFARICSDFQDFAERHSMLVKRLVKQGFKPARLKKSFLKFLRNYKDILTKYSADMYKHINDVLGLD